jgi:hypothetical protein
MAAGITEHGWIIQELLSFPGPPPRWTPSKQRGRPSHALKRLLERWCGDHGYMSYPVTIADKNLAKKLIDLAFP